MDLAKKRKVDSECRTFSREWMPKYFFTEFGKKAACLLCSESVAVLKEYKKTKHEAYGSTLSAAERQTKATELERKLVKQQNVFRKAKLGQFRCFCLLLMPALWSHTTLLNTANRSVVVSLSKSAC